MGWARLLSSEYNLTADYFFNLTNKEKIFT